MPQLNKGGKYVFGLSAISNRREILFPAETLEQYPVQKEGRIIIFTGSKITGGFCVTSKQLLGQSKLKHILDDCPALSQYTIDEGEFVRYKGRGYTWLHISQNGVVRLPENTMRYLNLCRLKAVTSHLQWEQEDRLWTKYILIPVISRNIGLLAAGNKDMSHIEWVLCPVCGSKTRLRIRSDTILENFPLFCPKCKHETLIAVRQLNLSIVQEPDAKTQSR